MFLSSSPSARTLSASEIIIKPGLLPRGIADGFRGLARDFDAEDTAASTFMPSTSLGCNSHHSGIGFMPTTAFPRNKIELSCDVDLVYTHLR